MGFFAIRKIKKTLQIQGFGDLDWIQTSNLLSRNQVRYSVAPRSRFSVCKYNNFYSFLKMKTYFLLIFSFWLFISCKKETNLIGDDWQEISTNVAFKSDGNFVKLKSGKFNYTISKFNLPYQKVILLNASLVGYFTELGLEDKIIGISSPEYVFSEKIHQLINKGKIQNIGNEQKYDIEKIIAIKPDVIFTNYIASFDSSYDLLKKNGIQIIFLDEYLEQNPLEKSKYLLVFGRLLGVEKSSVRRFYEIKSSYDLLKKMAKKTTNKPLVLANEMYGSQWFLPGGKTNLAQFISDANATYINAKNGNSEAVPVSFEEVFAKAENAKFWINVGNHQYKKELLQINPNYTKMKVYNEGKLYNATEKEKGKSNDYFESGVVRADLVLKDYIKIFHPQLLPNYKLCYMKKLK